jgi:hypothetical protein
MRDESSEKVAKLIRRDVVAMMRANHLAPDLVAEICVLDGPPDDGQSTRPDDPPLT